MMSNSVSKSPVCRIEEQASDFSRGLVLLARMNYNKIGTDEPEPGFSKRKEVKYEENNESYSGRRCRFQPLLYGRLFKERGQRTGK